jgi:ribosomal protein L2
MPLQKLRPTSPGRRFTVKVNTPQLHKGAPHEPLVETKTSTGGRNNNGRITTRHRGGGHKRRYRIIDFRRNKDDIQGKVERIEYDPNRSAHLALILYADGERRYILAPKNVHAGDQVMSGRQAPIKSGNALPLRNIPVGTLIHCIELKSGKGAQIVRAAGGSAQIVARAGGSSLNQRAYSRSKSSKSSGFGRHTFTLTTCEKSHPASFSMSRRSENIWRVSASMPPEISSPSSPNATMPETYT